MERFKKILLLVVLCATLCMTVASASPPVIVSESAVLIDADTGQIMYSKDMHRQMYPASITKILTVVAGLERLSMTDTMTMSHNAVFSIPYKSSHVALDEGETITMEQAVHAALLKSANDACNGIAERVAGTTEDFAVIMNETATKAGAINSNFVNPHGLYEENHYTTAYDMAMICRYALGNETFRKVFGTYKYVMAPTNEQEEERLFIHQHKMISDPNMKYEGIIGGKEGWTSVSKCTLVTAAERDGKTLIAVVMKCIKDDDKYADTKALLDYGFSGFTDVTITESDIPEELSCSLENDVVLHLPDDVAKSSLLYETSFEADGEKLIILNADGDELMRVPCTIKVEEPEVAEEAPAPENKGGISVLLIIGIIILVPIVLIALFLLGIIIRKKIYKMIRRHKRRKRRK